MNTKHIPDAALRQHIAILGKTGAGKSTTAKLAVEQVVADGARVCVLDPIKSDWWGLTSSADGRRPGLPFHILGGPRGHVPLHDAAGKAIAEVVAAGSLPLSIIDMADFPPGGQARFFVDFAPVLLRRMRGVLYLVMEEAHLFAPKERSGIGEESMAIHWSKMFATAGRSKGVRLVLLTQRTQALHNALLGSCDSIIAHRLTAPADQEPVMKWLKANTDKDTAERVAASLSSLKTGEGWLCSGEAQIFERRQFPRIETYDNTRTPTGADGEHHVKTAPVDADQLKAIIGEAVEKAKADDPRELRKRIAELERQAKGRPAEQVEVVREVPVPVLENGQLDRTEKVIGRLEDVGNKALAEAAELKRLIAPAFAPKPEPQVSRPAARVTPRPVPAPRPRTAPPPATAGEFRPNKPQQRVLDALAWYESLGNPAPTPIQVGAVALIDPTGGYFSNTVSPLSAGGLVERGNGVLSLTDAGRALAVQPESVGTLEDYHDILRRRVRQMKSASGKTIEILDTIIAAGGESLTAEQIGQAVGIDHTGGYFSNSIGPLGTAGLIVRRSGLVTPTEVLFPKALA
jgi:hypothetical protein